MIWQDPQVVGHFEIWVGFAPSRDSAYLTRMTDKPKRPRDANQLAKFIVDNSTMDREELEAHRKKLLTQDQSPGKSGSSKGSGSDAS